MREGVCKFGGGFANFKGVCKRVVKSSFLVVIVTVEILWLITHFYSKFCCFRFISSCFTHQQVLIAHVVVEGQGFFIWFIDAEDVLDILCEGRQLVGLVRVLL